MTYDIIHVELYHVNGHRGRKIYYRDTEDDRTKVASTVCCITGNPLSSNYQGAIKYCRRNGHFHSAINALISKLIKIQLKKVKTEEDWVNRKKIQKKIDIMAGKYDELES